MSKRATVTAVVNQKGGTGKTTTCENLGVGLAQQGKQVLLVDTDPQASLTIALGHPQPDELPITLSDLLAKVLRDEAIAPGEGILHHPEGVDLMPANIELAGMEVSLVNAMSRETTLRQYLDTVRYQYDHILLDCMPSLGMLTVNALAAADNLVIPVQAQYLPAKGLEQLLQTVSNTGSGSSRIKTDKTGTRHGDHTISVDSVPGFLFVLEAFGTNAQLTASGGVQRVWELSQQASESGGFVAQNHCLQLCAIRPLRREVHASIARWFQNRRHRDFFHPCQSCLRRFQR